MYDVTSRHAFRIQLSALQCLQEAAESALVTEFERKLFHINTLY
jgi:histone H3/H4